MTSAPGELDGALVLSYAEVTVDVRPTGRVRHDGSELLGPACALAIARYPDESDVYLFRLDEDGRVVTDTLHESVDDAIAQAAFEYEGLRWTTVGGGA